MNLASSFLCTAASGLLMLAAPLTRAELPVWQVDPELSRLDFTASQQGAAFLGTFREFSAEIRFRPDDPDNSTIQARIAMGSADTRNEERDGYLIGADFFAVELFPEARFESSSIRALGDGSFEARAQLTIRDVTREVLLPFQWAPAPDGSVHFTGEVSLQRLDFGIGQGIWVDTSWLGAEVLVAVNLTLTP